MQDELRNIPAVGEAVHWREFADLIDRHPRALVVRAISETAGADRERILAGQSVDLSRQAFVARVREIFRRLALPRLRRVINGTGIIVHTNLGRSVLAPEALAAVELAAAGYSTLEYDLSSRARGSRHELISELLCEITGAKAAMAVNNNAAAVLLSLNTLAEGKQVVVSRGELVEIGGSFRVPDVMAKSGCRLVEVGTTNKTHEHDFRNAVTDDTALFLKVHASNYRIQGFTASVSGERLARIGAEYGLPVMEDLGSGYLLGPSLTEMREEPTVQDAVKAGLSVITFSGDKLLGGPQAGIILGEPDRVKAIAKNPLARAVRLDKMTLAALEATLRLYREPEEAMKRIPTLRLARASLKVLREKARRLAQAIRQELTEAEAEVSMITTTARIGGGAMPLYDLPSAAVAIRPVRMSVNDLDLALHGAAIPIIGRIEDDRYMIDVRTLLDGETKIVENEICNAIRGKQVDDPV